MGCWQKTKWSFFSDCESKNCAKGLVKIDKYDDFSNIKFARFIYFLLLHKCEILKKYFQEVYSKY